jgi:hypothetical protein
MKQIVLAIAVSLMVPAYAEPTPEACDELTRASDALTNLIHNTNTKDLPLNDADKAEIKQAVDAFDKAMKDFYEIDKKVAKKKGHPKLKSVGYGLISGLGRLGTGSGGGYYAPYPVSPLMPMQNMMPTTFVNMNPAYGQSPFTTITPGFGNTYSVFHMGGF